MQRRADNERILHALDGLRKATKGDKLAAKGTTRAAVGRGVELDVYLARGCDTLTTEVCPGLLGRELFQDGDYSIHVSQAALT